MMSAFSSSDRPGDKANGRDDTQEKDNHPTMRRYACATGNGDILSRERSVLLDECISYRK